MRKLLILTALFFAVIGLQAEQIYKQTKYPNGHIKMEGLFEDGKPVGEIKRYHENGKLQGIQVFDINGNSTAEIYAGDGTLSAIGKYEGHKKVGIWSYFASSG